jgi:hypothetical protein
MRADLPCSVASEELMTGADLPSSIFYSGTQYRNGVTKGLITEADLPRGRKKGFPQCLFYCGLQFSTLFAKIAQVFAKLWPIYGFVSKFFFISAASPRAADHKKVE